MAFCDLCGDNNLEWLYDISEKSAYYYLISNFKWIIRKKDLEMILRIVCSKCIKNITNLVETVNNVWDIYLKNKENKSQQVTHSVEHHILDEDVKQLESEFENDGFEGLEWLDLSADAESKLLYQSNGTENYFKENSLYPSLNDRADSISIDVNDAKVIQSKSKNRFNYSMALVKFANEFIVHTEDGTKLICTMCNKVLYSKKDKVNHIRIVHLNERPYQCQFCKKRFTTKNFMNKHIKFMHSGFMHLCQICGENFKTKSALLTHKNRHSDTSAYKCVKNDCIKSFPSSARLKIHIKGSHSDEKHVCEKCGKTFLTSERAKIHSRRHSERTIQCPQCPQMFFTRSDLGPHMKHHKTWPWKCSKCNMSFKSTRGLQQHSSATHNEKLNRFQLYKISTVV